MVLRNSYIGVQLDKGEYTGPNENWFGDFMMTDIVRFGRPTFKKTNKGEDSFLFFWRNGWYIGKGPMLVERTAGHGKSVRHGDITTRYHRIVGSTV